jgi:hypothetical protein
MQALKPDSRRMGRLTPRLLAAGLFLAALPLSVPAAHGQTPPVPLRPARDAFTLPAFVPAFAPGYGQAINTRSPQGCAAVFLPDALFQQALAGSAWSVKFLVKTTDKADFLTRTARADASGAALSALTGQFLIGANRVSGTARVVLFPGGNTPLVIDGGAGANVADGQPHWIEVDCSGGNYYVYADGVLAGSVTGGTAWGGAGATLHDGTGTGAARIGSTAVDAGQPVDYEVNCLVDELGFYSASLHTGAASFTPDSGPVANNAAHQVALYHFDGNTLDSNTNTAP